MALVLAVAVAIGGAVAVAPFAAVVGFGCVFVAWAVFLHPPTAAYLLVGITPLVAGMDRGQVVPLLRPNEALALLLAGALAMRGLSRLTSGQLPSIRIGRVDASILAMAVASSVLPLVWMVARGKAVTEDDLLHALTLWKYYGIYLMIRLSVRTEQQVSRCVWVSMGAATVVATIAILQSLQVFGVPQLLAGYYAPFGNEEYLQISRGSSTLALAAAVADLMVFNLALAAGWMARGGRHRGLLVALSCLFVVGTLSSGQFSGAIALVVGGGAIAFVTRRLKPVVLMAPAVVAAGVLLRPVIERRLNAFDTPEGLPISWTTRIYNLKTYFWPELFSHLNFVLGVRPSARVPARGEYEGYIWIESGHTWLLWSGGIPLLLAFFYFLWTTVRKTLEIARQRMDAIGVAAVGSFVSLVVVAVLMTFDPHLTYRGSADILFALLALACTQPDRSLGKGWSPRT